MTATQRTFIIASVLVVIFALPAQADYRQDSRAINISGGEHHTLVLTTDKRAWACGPNGGYELFVGPYYGVLGTGSDDRYLEQKMLVKVHGPNDVNYLEDVYNIDAGWKHSLALDVNGFVWSWGWNSQGQLGRGIPNETNESLFPVQVVRGGQMDDPCQPSDYLNRIIAISAGRSGEHSLAIDEPNGYVYAWGRNKEGQCGNGENGTDCKEIVPVHVRQGEQPVDPNDLNNWLKHIIAVSAGERHSMALENYDPCDPNMDGRVYTWGDNEFWLGGDGVLGIGDNAENSNTPMCVHRGQQDYNEPNDIFLKHIIAISSGWDHSMAVEKYEVYDLYLDTSDPCYTGPDPNHKGRVYTWGNNGQGFGDGEGKESNGGRLGDGTTDSNTTPVLVLRGAQPAEDPNDPYLYLSRIRAVSAGEAHSMALDVNNYVYTWGDNQHGQLGDGTDEQRVHAGKGGGRGWRGLAGEHRGYLSRALA